MQMCTGMPGPNRWHAIPLISHVLMFYGLPMGSQGIHVFSVILYMGIFDGMT